MTFLKRLLDFQTNGQENSNVHNFFFTIIHPRFKNPWDFTIAFSRVISLKSASLQLNYEFEHDICNRGSYKNKGTGKNEFHSNAKISGFKGHKLQLMYLVELLTVKKYLRCGRGNKVKGGFMQKESQKPIKCALEIEAKVLYMSFDKFLAVESRDLSQADKSVIRVSSITKVSHSYQTFLFCLSTTEV